VNNQGRDSSNAVEATASDEIALPGDAFYPEGISVAADGSLYVGSLGGQGIVRVDAKTMAVSPFAKDAVSRNIVGLQVDDERGLLWACNVDMGFKETARLESYALSSGERTASFDFPAGGFCNDIALDKNGDVYATDSTLGAVRRLSSGGSELEEWIADPAFVPEPGAFGPNGIAIDGSQVFMARFDTAQLFRIPVAADGSASPFERIAFDKAPTAPDGLNVLAPGRLAIIDNFGGQVLLATVEGATATTESIVMNLDTPATAAWVNSSLWVTESQVDHLLGMDSEPPILPFKAKRVDLPSGS
jgi:sugar lactone lactonase YvrE